MQTRSSDENSVFLSVRLSVCPSDKRVICDKMEEISVQIFISYERSFSLVICPMRQQHWTDCKISLCVCQSVSQSVSEFWDPLHISGTVEARNFKFCIQIGHGGT